MAVKDGGGQSFCLPDSEYMKMYRYIGKIQDVTLLSKRGVALSYIKRGKNE